MSTHKFPARPDLKQGVLSIDLARFVDPSAACAEEVPLAAIAEQDRLVFYWASPDGSWSSIPRPHRSLRLRAALPPAEMHQVTWSLRSPIAVGKDAVIVVTKRPTERSRGGVLLVDPFRWDAGTGVFGPVADEPLVVPLDALGLRRSGPSLWSHRIGDELVIVTEAEVRRTEERALVLLRATMAPNTDLKALDQPAAWTAVVLDKGGYGADVLLDKDTLHIVHRRLPESLSTRIPATDPPVPVSSLLVHERDRYLGLGSLITYTPVVYLTVETATWAVTLVDEKVMGGEHVRIHQVEPLYLSMDRHEWLYVGVRTSGKAEEEAVTVTIKNGACNKYLVRRNALGWASDVLCPVDHEQWPLNLQLIQPAQQLVQYQVGRLVYATLVPPLPLELLRFGTEKKDELLVFLHESRSTGTLTANTYRVSQPDDPVLRVERIAADVYDIAHAQMLRSDAASNRMFSEAENRQFGPPVLTDPAAHPDGFRIIGTLRTVNTIGGSLIADRSAPHTYFGYVDMGDGGARLFHHSAALPPTPTGEPAPKQLRPEHVPGPGGGRWIRIPARDFVPSGLTGHSSAYADFLRLLEDENGAIPPILAFTTLLIIPQVASEINSPSSRGNGLQPLLDLLPHLAAISEGGGEVMDAEGIASRRSLVLDETHTDRIQEQITGLVTQDTAVHSDGIEGDLPFTVVQDPGRPTMPTGREIADGFVLRFQVVGTDEDLAQSTCNWVFTHSNEVRVLAAGSTVRVFPLQAGELTCIVSVRAPSGRTGTMTFSTTLTPRLWDQLWSIHEGINAPPENGEAFTVLGSFALHVGCHTLRFNASGGVRRSLTVEYGASHNTLFKAIAGPSGTQGRIIYRMPLELTSRDVRLNGPLSLIAEVRDLRIVFNHDRTFTPGVLTSDRRSRDIVRKQRSTPSDTETVRENGRVLGSGRPLAAALAAKPIDESAIEVDFSRVRLRLTPGARGVLGILTVLLGFVAMAVLVASIMLAVLPLLGPIALAGIVGITLLGPLVVAVLALGLGWVITERVVPGILNNIANEELRKSLEIEQERIRRQLNDQDIFTYAGEGLAEAIASKVIAQARTQGVDIPANTLPGRERMVPQLFECIVVTEGEISVLLRE